MIQCPLPASLSSLSARYIACVSSLGLGGGEQSQLSRRVLVLGVAAIFAISAACTERSPAMTVERSFTDSYELMESADPIGMGGFGVVLAAQNRETGEMVAVKQIPRLPDGLNERDVEEEVAMLKASGEHRHIVSFFDLFKDEEYYYLVMEMAQGGELFDHIMNDGMFTEDETANLMGNLLKACSFLHEQGIVHGDIKPENVMIAGPKKALPSDPHKNGTIHDDPQNTIDVRLADFGTATVMDPSRGTCTLSGSSRITVAYSPPEVIEQEMKGTGPVEVNPKTDVWALGVILYILLYGRHPYDMDSSASEQEMAEHILYTQPNFSDPMWDMILPSGLDLLKRMLHRDPSKRPTCREALGHKWFTECSGQRIGFNAKRRVTRAIHDFAAGRRMMKACFLATMIGLVKHKRSTKLSRIHTGKYAIGSRYTACETIDREKKGYIDAYDIMSIMEQLGERVKRDQANMMLCAVDGDFLSSCTYVLYDQMVKLVTPLCPPRVIKPGGVVYSEGEIDDMFYLIRHGDVEFSLNNPQICNSSIDKHRGECKLQSLHAGDSFGETELVLKNGKIFPRLATCKCTSVDNCELLMLQKGQFQLLTSVFDSVYNKIHSQSEVRVESLLQELLGSMEGEILTLEPGQRLTNARGVMVVDKGTVQVYDLHTSRLLTLGPKDHYFMCGPDGVMPYLGCPAHTALYIEGIEGDEPSQIRVIPESDITQLLGRKSMAGIRHGILSNGSI